MKKIKLWFFLAGAFLICGGAAYLIFFSGFFIVKSADLIGELSCVDNRQLLASIEIVGLNIFLTDSSLIEKTFKTNFSCIKSIKIVKKIPNRIILEVSNRQPQANLIILKDNESSAAANFLQDATSSAETKESFLVDEEGILFNGIQNATPRIYSFSKNMNLKNTLSILNKVEFFGIDVNEVSVNNGILFVFSPKMIFALDKNIDIQLASLQLILSKAKIDEETIEFIDLRFDKPVVRFAPKKK